MSVMSVARTHKAAVSIHQREHLALVSLEMFLGLTAFFGGIGDLFNWFGLPLELLEGAPFGSYAVPGLALALVGVRANARPPSSSHTVTR